MSEETVDLQLPIKAQTWEAIVLIAKTLHYDPADLIVDVLCLGLGALWDSLSEEHQRPGISSSQDLKAAVAKAVWRSRPGPGAVIPL